LYHKYSAALLHYSSCVMTLGRDPASDPHGPLFLIA
jgi:hypothetical protein